jgi:hypothetical protein
MERENLRCVTPPAGDGDTRSASSVSSRLRSFSCRPYHRFRFIAFAVAALTLLLMHRCLPRLRARCERWLVALDIT